MSHRVAMAAQVEAAEIAKLAALEGKLAAQAVGEA